MSFLFILIASTGIAWLVGRRKGSARDHARRGLAIAMVIAGITHFTRSEPFVQHLPDWVPGRELLVYLSGAVEILFGVALVRFSQARETVGRLLAMYLLAVFPANVYVALADVEVTGQAGGVFAWIRLPLQAVFIVWALWCTTEPSSHEALVPVTAARS
jgi:uncharacterized membrane protein